MMNKRFNNIDYDFWPESYWVISDPLGAILVNVKGKRRREMIRDFWEAGAIDQLEKDLLLDCLSEEQRDRLGKIHPSFMGGEYLPDYRKGEVEIARIELESTTADVISIRARKRGERIAYSIFDEYESDFCVSPKTTQKPLTTAELIGLIDGAQGAEPVCPAAPSESLAICFTVGNYSAAEQTMERLNYLRSFSRVQSVFYPQLNLHYEKLLDLRYEKERAKLLGAGAGL